MKSSFLSLVVVLGLGLNIAVLSATAESADAAEYSRQDLIQYIEAGQKIQAMKVYRSLYGVGLMVAKQRVDELMEAHQRGEEITLAEPLQEAPGTVQTRSKAAYLKEVDHFIAHGDLDQAAKAYFNAYSDEKPMSVIEARKAVEELARERRQ